MSTVAERVARVRGFNRFYTNVIGVLGDGLLQSPYSLAEVRVLYELANRGDLAVLDLRRDLGLDAGYLSRLLGRLAGDGLLVRERSEVDGRRQVIRLTAAGRATFSGLDRRSASEVERLLQPLSEVDQRRVVGAMATVEAVLGGAPAPAAYLLRPLLPGDLGWIVQRHGIRYSQEYGWDTSFEARVARIMADYAQQHDPRRENAWIAEVDGAAAGCVSCVRHDDDTAQLRVLLVEPAARGHGIGGRLVDECVRFAQRAGYRQIVLWTYDCLTSARRLYQAAGFELAEEHAEHSYGHDLTAQRWSRPLTAPAPGG
ncbi:MAG TPA: helix-turn-helix domain-containing GNAT family N-acetyltransferase [Mycobacteriales bacterium]|nr:helix-turn-helix domain-containing GNAT family N-acetyltransferase [Mycobacteriales bacterium]